jgi:hypothetical protein
VGGELDEAGDVDLAEQITGAGSRIMNVFVNLEMNSLLMRPATW